MTCRFCETTLPEDALFCGECGHPVASVTAAEAVPPATSSGFSISDLAFSSPGHTSDPDDDHRDLPDGSPLDPSAHDIAAAAARCPQCGEPMAEGDVFCGECGFVVRNVSAPGGDDLDRVASSIVLVPDLINLGEFPAEPGSLLDAHSDAKSDDDFENDADATTEVEPLVDDPADEPAERPVDEQDEPNPAPDGDLDPSHDGEPAEPDAAPEGEPDDQPDDEPDDESEDETSIDDLVLAAASTHAPVESDPDLEFDEPLPFAAPVPPVSRSPRSRPIPDPFPWGSDRPLREDIEATRLIADPASGTRYVLQFSTGESVTVAGSGLVGRNPSLQPGEYVDQLVPIFDAGKSVSKTHLEFGQEAGRFWVTDRYSTNGSVIRQPDAEPRRCDAGRRYFIARGTRVDVGEQFFVVS